MWGIWVAFQIGWSEKATEKGPWEPRHGMLKVRVGALRQEEEQGKPWHEDQPSLA